MNGYRSLAWAGEPCRKILTGNIWPQTSKKKREIQACTDTEKKAANMLHISSSPALTFFFYNSLYSCIRVAFTFKREEQAAPQHGLPFLLHKYTSVLDDMHQVRGKCVKIPLNSRKMGNTRYTIGSLSPIRSMSYKSPAFIYGFTNSCGSIRENSKQRTFRWISQSFAGAISNLYPCFAKLFGL